MPATVTLVYRAKPGLVPLAAFVTLFGAVPFDQGELDILGMSISTDVTVAGTNEAVRTIALTVLPFGESLYPTPDDKKSATRGIYCQTLSARTPALIAADEPVVT